MKEPNSATGSAVAAWPPESHPGMQSQFPRPFWQGKKCILVILFALVAHLALVWIFGDKKQIRPRPVSNVPGLHLGDELDPLMELDDPTLFALPNQHDFTATAWNRVPVESEPSFRWTEPPRWLVPDQENLQPSLSQLAGVSPTLRVAAELKPAAPLNLLPPEVGGAMPDHSYIRFEGSLATRPLLKGIDPPTFPYDNVIPPSRIQVLVDTAGQIVSAVLLPSTDSTEALERCDTADQRALELARQIRFAPASQASLGEIDFYWLAIPLHLNHSPTKP